MFDWMDVFAHAIYVGVVTGAFFLVISAFARVGWKYWHIVLILSIFVYWIM